MKLNHCLPSLLEKSSNKLFGLETKKRRHLKKRIIIRTDAAGGSVGWEEIAKSRRNPHLSARQIPSRSN